MSLIVSVRISKVFMQSLFSENKNFTIGKSPQTAASLIGFKLK